MELNRLMRYACLFLAIFLFFPLLYGTENTEQHLGVVFRNVAHEFLLQMDDSTSRVLPIAKEDGRYKVEFERDFGFEPAMLSFACYKVIDENEVIENYRVEVERCGSGEVVHGFEISSDQDDSMIPCRSRALPNGCYTVYFTVLEEEKMVQEDKADGKSFGWNTIYTLILLAVFFGLAVYFNRKKDAPRSVSNIVHIGRYQFDRKGMKLTLEGRQSVTLSSKEADLLFLLFSKENKTLNREYILSVVWGDEGDYVGRTLDVFISKLRKKLEEDSNLKIVNIRGVGYRLVIN